MMAVSLDHAVLHDDALDDYRIHDPHECTALLSELIRHKTALLLSAPGGPRIHAHLFELDAGTGELRFDARTRDLQLPADAPRLLALGYLDNVRVQFEVHGLRLAHDAHGPYLSARAPQEIFRFQRRSSVRVRPLLKDPPFAQLVYPSVPPSATRLRVLDISLGGLACLVQAPLPPPQIGERLDPVDVMLNEDTRFACTLMVRHAHHSEELGGWHVGAEFDGLDGMALRLLQRYIFDVQRARRNMAHD